MEHQALCTQPLKKDEIALFERAAEEDYYFEMYLDDLPFWGLIGEVYKEDLLLGHTSQSQHYVFTHIHFNISYNKDRIVAVNAVVPSSNRVDITASSETSIPFTYQVSWVEVDEPYENRMDNYANNHFLPSSFEIHWLAIINSFVLVMLLTAFLALILMRVLKNDFTRYLAAEEDDEAGEEETGWKLIHGDVFRPPPYPMLLSACVGTGAQIFLTVFSLLLLALSGAFSTTKRGAVMSSALVLYTFTAGVAGYVSARLYRQLGGTAWVWNIVLTAGLFSGPLFFVFAFLNSVAIANASSAALPALTIAIVLALFLVVAFPLTLVGGIAGRNMAADLEAPCRVTKVARQIPEAVWYRRGWVQVLMAGFLPFSAIYIELYYLFLAMWGRQVYTLFGILFLASLMLVIVTSFITIALTYFQLAIEDHRWWWRSFASGGSTGLFVYAYCFYYYFERTAMYGFQQTAFYFGYMACLVLAMFLMLGFVAFYSSLFFVRHIYRAIKCE